ncbi:twin-arginine translocase TatA/TatE family subunit [Streptomyces sp. NPDC008343]|uniref:twin-arginine translocase TatA/TatE family subunit n=1 Tax=Streptomyces sp. NPDC008343 TaxID=3364828 RepID=UPI0036EB8008
MLRNASEPWHLLLLLVVFILLFGHNKLPQAARGPGKSLRIPQSRNTSPHPGRPQGSRPQ